MELYDLYLNPSAKKLGETPDGMYEVQYQGKTIQVTDVSQPAKVGSWMHVRVTADQRVAMDAVHISYRSFEKTPVANQSAYGGPCHLFSTEGGAIQWIDTKDDLKRQKATEAAPETTTTTATKLTAKSKAK